MHCMLGTLSGLSWDHALHVGYFKWFELIFVDFTGERLW